MKDYQREELRIQAERASKALQSNCPLIEDEVTVAAYEHILELEDYVRKTKALLESQKQEEKQ